MMSQWLGERHYNATLSSVMLNYVVEYCEYGEYCDACQAAVTVIRSSATQP